MTEPGTRSASARLAASLALLVLAALLLVPTGSTRPAAWDELIAPLGVDRPVARGYVLSPPYRGEAHDVVYVARRAAGAGIPDARIELHIVDRGSWPGAAETRSFGVDWEAPPAGSLVSASEEDSRAVRDAFVEAIARNDTGFASVDSIPLASEPTPPIVHVLDRLSGLRGMVIGMAVALALVLLASVPRGAIAVGCLLCALGLALRVPSLGVPFVHDQDVQRLFTGHLPLRGILTGTGLEDRHPPFYFLVLHAVEQWGQSEAIGRAPAVVAGALAGPAILLATATMCGGIGPAAVLAALAVTVSPEMVLRSREVSEIPLFALIVIAAAASLVAALREPRWMRLATVALSHGLAFYTYYLAPFIVVAHAAVLLWVRRPDRRVVRAFVLGIVAALPAIALGGVTLLRDWGARDVARAFPALAWGEHAPAQMSAQMGRIAAEGFGVPLLVLIVVACAVGCARSQLAVLTPALAAAATFAGIALLSPIARVQAYYVSTVLPLALLPLAVLTEPRSPAWRLAWRTAVLLSVALSTVPLLTGARALYVPSADAFMPQFAAAVASRPESTVVTIAHYDKTLLAYYLARAEGRPIDWDNLDEPRAKRIEALLMVHALDAGSEQAALQRLEAIIALGPTLVIERDAVLLPRLVERLSACERIVQAPTGRLVRCGS